MYGSFSLLLTSELTSLSIPEFKVLITLSNFSLPNLGKGWSKADYIRCIVREVVNGNIVGLTGVVIGGGVGIDNKENGIPRTPLTNATSTAITTATTTATNNATTTASSSNNKKQVWLLVKTNPWNQRISPTTNTLFLNLDDRVIYSAAPSLESLDTRHFISAKRSISYDALEVHDADLDHIDGKNMTAIPPNRSSYTAPNPFDPASPYNSTHGHIQGHTNQEPLFTISTLTRPPQSSDFGLHLTIGVRGSFEVDGVRRLSSASDNNIAVGDLVVAVAGKGTQGRTLREVRQDLDLSTGGEVIVVTSRRRKEEKEKEKKKEKKKEKEKEKEKETTETTEPTETTETTERTERKTSNSKSKSNSKSQPENLLPQKTNSQKPKSAHLMHHLYKFSATVSVYWPVLRFNNFAEVKNR